MAISFSADDRARLAAVAGSISVPLTCLLAVITVESGGQVYASVGGRQKPLIRFEGHYFYRLCSDVVRDRAVDAGLASPHPGAVANPPSQAARWALLDRAAALDRQAAYESCSWGVGQVMGEHWRDLGYPSVLALVDEACSGLAGQAALMAKFIAHSGLDGPLRQRDWPAFARRYNGPAYARNGYDRNLARAFGREVQRMLCAAGYQVAVDGAIGLATQAAIKAFQAARGLDVDGIAGPATLAALEASVAVDPAPGTDPVPASASLEDRVAALEAWRASMTA